MVETLFCWAVELPPASGACLLTSRWLWKLKNNFRGKSPQRQGQSCQYILFIFQLNFSDILTARFPISFGSQVFISIRPKWSIGRSVSFIFLWSHFNQSTFHPNFFQFWPRQSILPARPTMLLKSIITKLNNKHYHIVFKLFYNPTTSTVCLN